MTNLLSEDGPGGKHQDQRPSEIVRSEKNVKSMMTAIESFMNPFETEDHDKLYCLSSGAAASPEIEADILRARLLGKEGKETVIRQAIDKYRFL